jgi:hypothetical protein
MAEDIVTKARNIELNLLPRPVQSKILFRIPNYQKK